LGLPVSLSNSDAEGEKLKFSDRIQFGYNAVKEIVRKVWIYVVIGIAVGAWAHGYVPEDFMASLMGKSLGIVFHIGYNRNSFIFKCCWYYSDSISTD
jgi:uncharacterized membrane protein YraQ (UPF0718 family)